ncbi:CubicO group peptidase (beta-lactamase class C family) [Diaminobutyricimonas aerilata]|uniref:CubicO group peptidase (Beta-lactamase class C family) n=1 Tax=Diaminobutyricimonas aerilata TaxID=1162967 RepID=A0A2M9CG54_9MICO|nr:serine hydrolase domain-containing protein [Diaminobutyricimonas aerilata]PJJ70893.1 CubicO group peptidase (beta-lactamase class C family) [Diaminobutyricimonas aerilata]
MSALAQVRPRIAEILARYQTPGATVGILHRGELTELAYGVKDITTGEPVASDTVFQCGSLTKSWTALAFMQLVDEGEVALDEPVRSYLPEFRVADPAVSAQVTSRQLLNHTSGIEESFGDPGDDDDVYERMVEAVADAPQVSPFGSVHGYSAALGYAILARIMEVIDGKPWHRIMAERLFTPMGITDTHAWREEVDTARAARGHLIRSLGEGPIPTPVDDLPRAFGAGGAITSTIRDVLALAHVYLHAGLAPNGQRIVSAAAIREMTTSRVPIPDPYTLGREWALGLVVADWHGHTVYGHDGSTIGQNARLRILPDDDLALALLSNGDPREGRHTEIFNLILEQLGTVTIPPLPTPDPSIVLDPARYVGVFERPGTRFEVTAEQGTLQLHLEVDSMQAAIMGTPDRITHDLLPIDDTHFLMPPNTLLEEAQTAAIFGFRDGRAHYLHTNARLHPRRS